MDQESKHSNRLYGLFWDIGVCWKQVCIDLCGTGA